MYCVRGGTQATPPPPLTNSATSDSFPATSVTNVSGRAQARGGVALERRCPTCRRSGPCEVRLETGAEAGAGGVLELRGCVLLHLAVDRHFHSVHPWHRPRRSCVLLELADRSHRTADHRIELRRGQLSLPGRRVRLSVDEVPLESNLCVVHRLDLPVRGSAHSGGGP